MADHLSRLEGARDDVPVNDEFPDEKLLAIEDMRAVMKTHLSDKYNGI